MSYLYYILYIVHSAQFCIFEFPINSEESAKSAYNYQPDKLSKNNCNIMDWQTTDTDAPAQT